MRWKSKRLHDVTPPRNAVERLRLCGFSLQQAIDYWDSSEAADNHRAFFIAGQTQKRPNTVRLWQMYRRVTGCDPDTSPQPTGDCVAASARDTLEFLQACEIDDGERETYRDLFAPYHYATGRVLIGKNRLRGGAGSIGGWQAAAIEQYGCLEMSQNVPAYNKRNVDAWGDDRAAEGQSFRDYIEHASARVVKATARVTTLSEVFDAIANKYPCTIASNRGYKMRPDRDGYHRPAGRWSHQMSIVGYSIAHDWVAIKNQWGAGAHGTLIDNETGEQWPGGFLRVHIDDFERSHLRGSETIAYSRFEGFPEQTFDHSQIA